MDVSLALPDESKLFTSTSYTDGIAGGLQVNQPVNFDGHAVISRPTEYLGWTNIQTTGGPIPVRFTIPASSLREAFEKWPELAKAAVTKTIENLQSQQFKRALLTPGGKRS